MNTLNQLPRELILSIVTDNTLEIASLLYACCKSFDWLCGVYYTRAVRSLCKNGFETTDLFGRLQGPSCWLTRHATLDGVGTEYGYFVYDEPVGTHCYNVMMCANFGVNIINGETYRLNGDDLMYTLARQIYEQMARIDPVMRALVDGYRTTDNDKYVVRKKVPPNTYTLTLPEIDEHLRYGTRR